MIAKIVSLSLLCVATGWTAARHEVGPAIFIGLAAVMVFCGVLDLHRRAIDHE